jgi:hypothetical protein
MLLLQAVLLQHAHLCALQSAHLYCAAGMHAMHCSGYCSSHRCPTLIICTEGHYIQSSQPLITKIKPCHQYMHTYAQHSYSKL